MSFTKELEKQLQGLWKTKDGQTMLISDMEDQHLNNAIRYMVRNGKGTTTNAKALMAEKDRRIKGGIMVRSAQCREDTLIFGDD
jgi:hypothetical protein